MPPEPRGSNTRGTRSPPRGSPRARRTRCRSRGEAVHFARSRSRLEARPEWTIKNRASVASGYSASAAYANASHAQVVAAARSIACVRVIGSSPDSAGIGTTSRGARGNAGGAASEGDSNAQRTGARSGRGGKWSVAKPAWSPTPFTRAMNPRTHEPAGPAGRRPERAEARKREPTRAPRRVALLTRRERKGRRVTTKMRAS